MLQTLVILYVIILIYLMVRLGWGFVSSQRMLDNGASHGDVLYFKWMVIRHCLLIFIPATVILSISAEVLM